MPAAVRAALVEHANAELPNEACGLILFEDDTAVEYVPGTNASASPYHFELQIDPLTWADLNDRDVVQAVFHSHISSPPRPSRTDVQNIDVMKLAGFCRNCLSKWYRAAAEERGVALSDPDAREAIYGMPYEDWKAKYQTDAKKPHEGH